MFKILCYHKRIHIANILHSVWKYGFERFFCFILFCFSRKGAKSCKPGKNKFDFLSEFLKPQNSNSVCWPWKLRQLQRRGRMVLQHASCLLLLLLSLLLYQCLSCFYMPHFLAFFFQPCKVSNFSSTSCKSLQIAVVHADRADKSMKCTREMGKKHL